MSDHLLREQEEIAMVKTAKAQSPRKRVSRSFKVILLGKNSRLLVIFLQCFRDIFP